ncbi:hypothetical protein Ciccas_009110 [Cichlidogyrus casuarinus]|uniref:Uncharacterized protein n=1 Tax=Cichlidogyrus casuarinus TaxID=1844966 RepID=A0ABD2PYX8_9PLAT
MDRSQPQELDAVVAAIPVQASLTETPRVSSTAAVQSNQRIVEPLAGTSCSSPADTPAGTTGSGTTVQRRVPPRFNGRHWHGFRIQLEDYFRARQITTERDRFHELLSCLDTSVAEELHSQLQDSEGMEKPITAAIGALARHYTASVADTLHGINTFEWNAEETPRQNFARFENLIRRISPFQMALALLMPRLPGSVLSVVKAHFGEFTGFPELCELSDKRIHDDPLVAAQIDENLCEENHFLILEDGALHILDMDLELGDEQILEAVATATSAIISKTHFNCN